MSGAWITNASRTAHWVPTGAQRAICGRNVAASSAVPAVQCHQCLEALGATRTICAWCGVHMKGDPQASRVSHGICGACYEKQTGKKFRSKNPVKCKNPCRNPRHRHANPWNAQQRHRHANPWNAQQLDGVARLATSVYSGARTFGFANPPACWNCSAPVSGDLCKKCWAGQTDDNPPHIKIRKGTFASPERLAAWAYSHRDPQKALAVAKQTKRLARSRGGWFGNPDWASAGGVPPAFKGKCRLCGAPATHQAQFKGDPHVYFLCAEHVAHQAKHRDAKISKIQFKKQNPQRKHKPGCACAACSAHRKKVGSRTGAAGASPSGHVKALDKFIAKNHELASRCRRIQQRLMGDIKVGKYSRSAARKEWRGLIDAGCRISHIPLSAAARAHMTKAICEAFERKIRHGNPSVAIVGAGLNPGKRHGNPTDSRKKGDRGFAGTITLAGAWKRAAAAGMLRQFDENVRAHKEFHGVAPDSVRVYRKNDGKKALTVEVGSVSGRVPEMTYIAGKLVPGSNKSDRFYVHKHPKGAMPVEVWLAHKQAAMRVGGTQKRTSWYYH